MAVDVSEINEVIERINTYQVYQQQEGIPVYTGFAVEDLRALELGPWARRGGSGAFINLDGTGGTNDAYVCEIPPGGSLAPQRQLYEEMVYVLEGNGSTLVWYDEARKVHFEWKTGSLFAIPLNAFHRHFNGRGDRPARFLAVTSAPMVMNLFHNLNFIFETPYVFDDRFAGDQEEFSGQGKYFRSRGKRTTVLETNFVPDTHGIQLYSWKERGAGGKNIMFELAHQTMAAHISEFPVGTYKKGHRHGPGAHVIILSGDGYSLLWPEGSDLKKVDWRTGSMVVPPNDWFHQHFNPGAEPARYLALRWGSKRYDMGGAIKSGEESSDVSVKEGGLQIEYEDEDPRILSTFEEETRQRGAESRMREMIDEAKAKAKERERAVV
jgi:oxalate decarboxylase/phosphoglucose isomerase-like protein (cupin superfamily)